MDKIDVLVIGAGVVGLAVARSFALKGREVIVAERDKIAGSGISSRNSGVIHAGIYYPKTSKKAALCVQGKNLLYKYVKSRRVPHNNCTKLIVACTQDEIPKLEAIKQKALNNGVHDLLMISKEEALEMEPSLSCHGALYSPSTGIVDIHELMQEFIVDIEDSNGIIAFNNSIDMIEKSQEGLIVSFSDNTELYVNTIVNAAGLNAQAVAKKIKGLNPDTIPNQYLAKGNYFGVTGEMPFSRLIYPVPVQGGLGAHFTMNMAHESLFGPDVEWLDQNREFDFKVNPNRAQKFYDSISRFWPEVNNRELFPAYAGIRPKISKPGMPDGDFIIQTEKDHGISGLINLYGIESPGLTSSMAIADAVTKEN